MAYAGFWHSEDHTCHHIVEIAIFQFFSNKPVLKPTIVKRYSIYIYICAWLLGLLTYWLFEKRFVLDAWNLIIYECFLLILYILKPENVVALSYNGIYKKYYFFLIFLIYKAVAVLSRYIISASNSKWPPSKVFFAIFLLQY